MNRPCRIHFHYDSTVCVDRLLDRHPDNLEGHTRAGITSYALLAQNAFYIDFNPQVLRTRINGKDDDPTDFPVESISHIEWFYGDDVPDPLVPWAAPPSKRQQLEY